MGKKVIRLNEADIENIVRKVILEQTEEVLLNRLNDKIESVMKEKQNEIFNGVNLVASKSGNNFIIKFNNKPLTLTADETYKGYQGYLPTWTLNDKGVMVIPSIPIKNFYDEIFLDEDLKNFYDTNEYIKQQMDELLIPLNVNFRKVKGLNVVIFPPNRKISRNNRKYLKNHSGGNIGRLGDFYSRNFGAFELEGVNYEIESNGWEVKLGRVSILPRAPKSGEGEPPLPPPIIAPQTIELKLIDIFNYDDIDIVNPTEYQNTLNNFKLKLDNAVKNLKGYEDFLNGQTLTVYGYASQDAKSDDKDGGSFAGCETYGKGKGPRKDYNMCLSQKRAEKVADDVQEIFTDLGLTTKIKGVGKGETYEFGGDGFEKNGKDSEEDLAKNRRVTFVLPSFTEEL